MNTIELYDPYAAAFLSSMGVELLMITENERMVFDDSNGDASRALSLWSSGNAFIPARKYINCFKQVKQLQRQNRLQSGTTIIR